MTAHLDLLKTLRHVTLYRVASVYNCFSVHEDPDYP